VTKRLLPYSDLINIIFDTLLSLFTFKYAEVLRKEQEKHDKGFIYLGRDMIIRITFKK